MSAPRHRLPRTRHRLRFAAAMLTVVGMVLVLPGVASAFFTSTGIGFGTATVGTLSPPASVTATYTGSQTANITWTASPGTPTPDGYYVVRGDTPVIPVCDTSPTDLKQVGAPCTDTGVTMGTHHYDVIAVYKSWTAVASTTLTVSTLSQTITFNAPSSPVYLDNATLTATATSGLPVTFASDTTDQCTVTEDSGVYTVNYLHAGTNNCTITANQAGGVSGSFTYDPAPQVSQTFSIAKGDQVITITSIPENPGVGGEYELSAYANSGLPLTFGTTTSTQCSKSGSAEEGDPVDDDPGTWIQAYELKAAGTCVVTVNATGNTDWNAAPQVTQTFTIETDQNMAIITDAPHVPPDVAEGGGTYDVYVQPHDGTNYPVVVTIDPPETGPAVCTVGPTNWDGTTYYVAQVTWLTGVAGECIIHAHADGGGGVNPADDYLSVQVVPDLSAVPTITVIGINGTPIKKANWNNKCTHPTNGLGRICATITPPPGTTIDEANFQLIRKSNPKRCWNPSAKAGEGGFVKQSKACPSPTMTYNAGTSLWEMGLPSIGKGKMAIAKYQLIVRAKTSTGVWGVKTINFQITN